MPRYEGIAEFEPSLHAAGLRVGVVMSRFNADICEGLLSGCIEALQRMGAAQIEIASVPGALEIPLTLKVMAASGRFDALVALGAVIRGETYHFEIVSNEMAAGITRITLDTGLPIGNGVLTTEDDDQALVRMHQKGREAAEAAVEMVNLHKALRT